MPTTVTDYSDFQERLSERGFLVPTQLALLPSNLETAKQSDELFFASSAATIRKLLKQSGIVETPIESPTKKLPELQQNDFSLVLPALFVGYSLWSQNPALLNVALSVVGNYATDFFKGIAGQRKVRLDIVIERSRGKEFKRIRFEGSPDELKDLPKVIRELNRNAP